MLEAHAISVRYGQAIAVSDVSLDVGEQAMLAVIGANGAGKSSLARAIAGLTPHEGTVFFDGRDLTKERFEGRVRAGVVYVPEGRRVFAQMSVHDNLKAGAFTRRKSDWQAQLDEIYERVPRLAERKDVKATLLSGGEQQMLAICRALMARPRLLLLDEPSLGLSPMMIADLSRFLRSIRDRDRMSILIFEQNVSFAAHLADAATLLRLGSVSGTLGRDEVSDIDVVRRALLGEGAIAEAAEVVRNG